MKMNHAFRLRQNKPNQTQFQRQKNAAAFDDYWTDGGRRISCGMGHARQFRLDSSGVPGYLIGAARLLTNDDTLKNAGSAGCSRPIPAGANARIGAG